MKQKKHIKHNVVACSLKYIFKLLICLYCCWRELTQSHSIQIRGQKNNKPIELHVFPLWRPLVVV